jgi:isoamylase
LPELATRLTGSADLFNRRGRKPRASVNFVTAHDGFTLADLVSYNNKHNEANGEDNRDGHNDNRSFNYGAEGATENASIRETRLRQQRNMLATLMLSQGTRRRVGRKQRGNNNAYCQDNEISWFDWNLGPDAEALVQFTRRLIGLRHPYPVLHRKRSLTGDWNEALKVKDAAWLTPTGEEMRPKNWKDPLARCVGLVLDGRGQATGIARRGSDATLLIIVNANNGPLQFKLPKVTGGRAWLPLIDTCNPLDNFGAPKRPGPLHDISGGSVLVLRLVTDRRAAV